MLDLEAITGIAIVATAAGLFIRRFVRELSDAKSEAEQHACGGCTGCAAKTPTDPVTHSFTFLRSETNINP